MKKRHLLTGAVLAAALTTAAGQPPAGISFALTGDTIITRRLSVYTGPAFLRVIDLIRGADVAFTDARLVREAPPVKG